MNQLGNVSQDDISEDLSIRLQQSQSVLTKAFKEYDCKQIFLSFNGGKDCTVLFHLLSEHLKESVSDLKVIYLRPAEPFEEIDEFVKSCESYYGVKVRTVQSEAPMKEVLTRICDSDKEIQAVFMGSRRSDPYCQNLNAFEPTDRGWPKLMRINAMLDWTCANVWEYLLWKNVPYCSLYERGYTSIGNRNNTRPNPHLEIKSCPGTYQPAYKLIDDSLERAGRN